MAAKKPGAQATVTLKHLAANLSEAHEMSTAANAKGETTQFAFCPAPK